MIKKAKVEGKIVDVMQFDQYTQLSSDNIESSYTAIEKDGILYPVKSKTDVGPGMYRTGPICKFIKPSQSEINDYAASESNVINFSDTTSIRELIEKQDQLKNMERTILTTVDNVFAPKVDEKDFPEMALLKQAVCKKNVDLDKYKTRFGSSSSYNNDRRLFNDNSITFGKLRSMCQIFDLKASLIIEDKSPDVPNPIGEKLIIDLTPGGEE